MHFDIVYGLKYCVSVRKMGIVLSKEEENIGSYAPAKDEHTFTFAPTQVPSGVLVRNSF